MYVGVYAMSFDSTKMNLIKSHDRYIVLATTLMGTFWKKV